MEITIVPCEINTQETFMNQPRDRVNVLDMLEHVFGTCFEHVEEIKIIFNVDNLDIERFEDILKQCRWC